MKRNIRVLLVVLVVLALAGGVFAFAAANTIADSAAGYKAFEVDGYAITNVKYALDATTPTLLDYISFDIAPKDAVTAPAQTVLISTTGETQNFGTSKCVISGTTTKIATCTFGSMVEEIWTSAPIAVDSVLALDVVASSSVNP